MPDAAFPDQTIPGFIEEFSGKLGSYIRNRGDFDNIAYFNHKAASMKYSQERFCRQLEACILNGPQAVVE